MPNIYGLIFASGDPRPTTVLQPTILTFQTANGLTAITAPGITQPIASSGLFTFEYDPTLPIYFLADGGASAAASARYLAGIISPSDNPNLAVTTLGASILPALTVLGSTASSVGSTNTDPGDIMGYLKRAQEWNEGNSIFTKTSGIWQVSTRGNTLLAQKTLANTVTSVTKS